MFRTAHVRTVDLFGSRARDEARADSDVDLLVDFEPDAQVSLLDLVRLERLLSERLKLTVQVTTAPVRRERLRQAIEADKVHVF